MMSENIQSQSFSRRNLNLSRTSQDADLTHGENQVKKLIDYLWSPYRKDRPQKVQTCCAFFCKNTSVNSADKHFFEFPASQERRAKWLRHIGIKPSKRSVKRIHLCSDHFKSSDFINEFKNRIHPDAFPTIQTPENAAHRDESPEREQRSTSDLKNTDESSLLSVNNSLKSNEEAITQCPFSMLRIDNKTYKILSVQVVKNPDVNQCNTNSQQISNSNIVSSSTDVSTSNKETSCSNVVQNNSNVATSSSSNAVPQIVISLNNISSEKKNLEPSKTDCAVSILKTKQDTEALSSSRKRVSFSNCVTVLNEKNSVELKDDQADLEISSNSKDIAVSEETYENVAENIASENLPSDTTDEDEGILAIDSSTLEKEWPGCQVQCSAYFCENTIENSPDKHFFEFPENKERRAKWFSSIGVKLRYRNRRYLLYFCSDHFKSSDFTDELKDCLRPGAFPTIERIKNDTHGDIASGKKQTSTSNPSPSTAQCPFSALRIDNKEYKILAVQVVKNPGVNESQQTLNKNIVALSTDVSISAKDSNSCNNVTGKNFDLISSNISKDIPQMFISLNKVSSEKNLDSSKTETHDLKNPDGNQSSSASQQTSDNSIVSLPTDVSISSKNSNPCDNGEENVILISSNNSKDMPQMFIPLKKFISENRNLFSSEADCVSPVMDSEQDVEVAESCGQMALYDCGTEIFLLQNSNTDQENSQSSLDISVLEEISSNVTENIASEILPSNTTETTKVLLLEDASLVQKESHKKFRTCAAYLCENTDKNCKKKFFPFPKEEEKKRLWLQKIKIKEPHHSEMYLCSDHFALSAFTSTFKQQLTMFALPTIQVVDPERKIIIKVLPEDGNLFASTPVNKKLQAFKKEANSNSSIVPSDKSNNKICNPSINRNKQSKNCASKKEILSKTPAVSEENYVENNALNSKLSRHSQRKTSESVKVMKSIPKIPQSTSISKSPVHSTENTSLLQPVQNPHMLSETSQTITVPIVRGSALTENINSDVTKNTSLLESLQKSHVMIEKGHQISGIGSSENTSACKFPLKQNMTDSSISHDSYLYPVNTEVLDIIDDYFYGLNSTKLSPEVPVVNNHHSDRPNLNKPQVLKASDTKVHETSSNVQPNKSDIDSLKAKAFLQTHKNNKIANSEITKFKILSFQKRSLSNSSSCDSPVLQEQSDSPIIPVKNKIIESEIVQSKSDENTLGALAVLSEPKENPLPIFRRCAAYLCKNTSRNCTKSFFKFPKVEERRKLWLKNIEVKCKSAKSLHLCSDHFENHSFTSTLKRRLITFAVPTIQTPFAETEHKQVDTRGKASQGVDAVILDSDVCLSSHNSEGTDNALLSESGYHFELNDEESCSNSSNFEKSPSQKIIDQETKFLPSRATENVAEDFAGKLLDRVTSKASTNFSQKLKNVSSKEHVESAKECPSPVQPIDTSSMINSTDYDASQESNSISVDYLQKLYLGELGEMSVLSKIEKYLHENETFAPQNDDSFNSNSSETDKNLGRNLDLPVTKYDALEFNENEAKEKNEVELDLQNSNSSNSPSQDANESSDQELDTTTKMHNEEENANDIETGTSSPDLDSSSSEHSDGSLFVNSLLKLSSYSFNSGKSSSTNSVSSIRDLSSVFSSSRTTSEYTESSDENKSEESRSNYEVEMPLDNINYSKLLRENSFSKTHQKRSALKISKSASEFTETSKGIKTPANNVERFSTDSMSSKLVSKNANGNFNEKVNAMQSNWKKAKENMHDIGGEIDFSKPVYPKAKKSFSRKSNLPINEFRKLPDMSNKIKSKENTSSIGNEMNIQDTDDLNLSSKHDKFKSVSKKVVSKSANKNFNQKVNAMQSSSNKTRTDMHDIRREIDLQHTAFSKPVYQKAKKSFTRKSNLPINDFKKLPDISSSIKSKENTSSIGIQMDVQDTDDLNLSSRPDAKTIYQEIKSVISDIKKLKGMPTEEVKEKNTDIIKVDISQSSDFSKILCGATVLYFDPKNLNSSLTSASSSKIIHLDSIVGENSACEIVPEVMNKSQDTENHYSWPVSGERTLKRSMGELYAVPAKKLKSDASTKK